MRAIDSVGAASAATAFLHNQRRTLGDPEIPRRNGSLRCALFLGEKHPDRRSRGVWEGRWPGRLSTEVKRSEASHEGEK
jgi:hypothetical protein